MNSLLEYIGHSYKIFDNHYGMSIDVHGPYWVYGIPVDPNMHGIPSEPAYPIQPPV